MKQAESEAKAVAPICRLAIKLARAAPISVLLRRGPTHWTQLIKWNMDTDTFEPGQWFRGRIYEEGCSLSDDGELFLYLARKDTKRTLIELGSEVWTALSRPPYFTALALWPHPAYGGGGRFTGARSAILNTSPTGNRIGKLPSAMSLRPVGLVASFSLGAESAMDAGWQATCKDIQRFHYHGWQLQTDWEKQSADGALRLLCSGRRAKERRQAARIVLRFSLLHGERVHEVGDADFVEIDHRGRVIMGRDGKVLVCADPFSDVLSWHVLADFSHSKPTFSPPPGDAMQWPAD